MAERDDLTFEELVAAVRRLAKNQQTMGREIEALRREIPGTEQSIRADMVNGMSRLVSMHQAQELEIRHLREIFQSQHIALTALVKRDEPRAQKIFTAFLNKNQEAWARALSKRMYVHFDMRELENLCWDLGIPIDEFPDEGRTQLCKDICGYMMRRKKLSDLAAYCFEKRPDPAIEWPMDDTAFDTKDLVDNGV